MDGLFNFGTFFKFLGKNKLYTLIDVFGLSVSLMFVILIGVYTYQELSTDRFQSKAGRIYVLGDENNHGSAYRLAYRIQERYPEIEKVCPVAPCQSDVTVSVREMKFKTNVLFVDSTFFDFFDFKFNAPNPAQVFAARNNAVISRSFARKAFGNEDPLGKVIPLNDSVSVIINGIMDDIKNSTIPYADLLVRIDNVKYFNRSMDSETFDNSGSTFVFVMEKENAHLQDKTEDMLTFFKEIFWIYRDGLRKQVQFIPLQKIYFSDISAYGQLKQGDWKLVMILMSVGLVILLFAVINYINLTVAQSGFRAKEMAARRLLGSTRQELFARLMLESTLLCLMSFLLAVFLAFLCVPYADSLLKTKIDLPGAVSVWSLLASVSLILILGAVSGWLPATFISNVKPIDIVKGNFRKKNRMIFSRFFIIFQNVITIMLLTASITMVAQINHLIHAPLGYNTKNIIDIFTWNRALKNKEEMAVFANEVKQLASVKRVGFAQGTPFDRGNNYTVRYNDKSIHFQILGGDTACFQMFDYKILKENNLGNRDGYHAYFSRQAMKECEFADTDDATEISFFDGNWVIHIDGIMEDLQLKNITQELSPVQYRFTTLETDYPWNILIETQGDPAVAFEQIKQVFERMTQTDFNGQYIEDQIKESFGAQQRISQIVVLFTAIALLISLLGLLAMSTYFIRQNTKQVAIRKVHGADNFKVLSELVLSFLGYVGIAFVIAVPIIYYIMNRWLSDYAYRISLSLWIFVAAGGFCLLVSFVSVYWQSRRAAHANPVRSLSME